MDKMYCRKKWVAVALLPLLLLSGCFDGESSSSTDKSLTSAGSSVYGAQVSAYVAKSSVSGATCSLYSADNTLLSGPAASSGGRVSFAELGSKVSGMVYVQCVQGTYTDESTGVVTNAPTMRTAVDITRPSTFPATSGVYKVSSVVSPLTELAMRKSQSNLSDFKTQAASLATALGLSGVDLAAVQPTDLNSAKAGYDNAGRYGTFLAGLTEAVRTGALGSDMTAAMSAVEAGTSGNYVRSSVGVKLKTAIANLPSVSNTTVASNYNSASGEALIGNITQQQSSDPYVLSITTDQTQPFLYGSQVKFTAVGGNLSGAVLGLTSGTCGDTAVASDGNSASAGCTMPTSGTSVGFRVYNSSGVVITGGSATYTLSATTNTSCSAGTPTITGVTPTTAEYGTTQQFSISGCNLVTANMTVDLGGITCTNVAGATNSLLQTNCQVGNDRTLASKVLTIANYGGNVAKTQTINLVTPSVIVTSANPSSVRQGISAPSSWSLAGSGLYTGLVVRYNGMQCTSSGTANSSGTALTGINCSNVTSPTSGQTAQLTVTGGSLTGSVSIGLQALVTPVLTWSNNLADGGVVSQTGTVGGTYTLTVSSPSSGAINYSSSNTSVATVDAATGVVTFKQTGRTVITAAQAEVPNAYSAASTTYILDVTVNTTSATVPVFTFANGRAVAKTYGAESFINAVSISCGSETYGASDITYLSSESTAAAVSSSGEVTINGVGSGKITISAVVPAKGSCDAGVSSYVLTVAKAAPTMLFTPATESRSTGAADFIRTPTITWAKAASTTALTYASSKTTVATVDATGLVHIVGAGSATITASFPGDSNYTAATASYTLTVQPAVQTLQFTNTGTINKTYGTDKTYANTAGGSCNGAAYAADSISYSSSDATHFPVATDGTVGILYPGTATITASVAATSACAATSTSYTLSVAKFLPTITQVGAATVGPTQAEFAAFEVTWNAGDPAGTVSYSSANTAVATISASGQVTPVGVGTTVLTATIAADERYETTTKSYTLTVSRMTPTFSFATTLLYKAYGEAAYSNLPTYSCSGATYSSSDVTYSSSDPTRVSVDASGQASILNTTLTNTPVVITATLAAKGDCNSATTSYSVNVTKATPTISNAGSGSVTVGTTTSPFTVTWPATVGTVTYSSSNTSIATVSAAGVVTGVAVGSATITATVTEDEHYNTATNTKSVTVTATPTLSFASSSLTKAYGDANFTNVLTNSCSGASYSSSDVSYTSSDTTKASVSSDGLVTVREVGSVTITASLAAKGSCSAATASYALTIGKATPTITFASGFGATASRLVSAGTYSPFVVTWPSGVTAGMVSYASNAMSVATISNSGLVTPVAAGTSTLTASIAADTHYNAVSLTQALTLTTSGGVAPILNFATTTLTVPYGASSFTNPLGASCSSAGIYTASEVSYTSSDPTKASVTSAGLVTVKEVGSATITASVAAKGSCSAATASYALTIIKATPTITLASGLGAVVSRLVSDGTYSPFVVTWPSGVTPGSVNYTSSATSVATISSAGLVTPVAAGTTTLSASIPADTHFNAVSLAQALTLTTSGGGGGTATYYSISGTVTNANTGSRYYWNPIVPAYGLTLVNYAHTSGSTTLTKVVCLVGYDMTDTVITQLKGGYEGYFGVAHGLGSDSNYSKTACSSGNFNFNYTGSEGILANAAWKLEIYYLPYYKTGSTGSCKFTSKPTGFSSTDTSVLIVDSSTSGAAAAACPWNATASCPKLVGTAASATGNLSGIVIDCSS